MGTSDWYIGAPNGVVICVDGMEDRQFRGRFYHGYSEAATEFEDIDQILFELEHFFDFLNFPHATTEERSFRDPGRRTENRQEREKVMKDKELLQKHGELGTFIVRVQHRQHNSWQGRITWMEENRTVYFRSIWELVKLLVSAVETTAPEAEEKEPSWFEGDDAAGLPGDEIS
ncbi:MAG: hypothetical protein HFI64_00140 [Lachnospiraceae bacterium]|nr:hypothetical protein [Lachnospiraceae bacterium]